MKNTLHAYKNEKSWEHKSVHLLLIELLPIILFEGNVKKIFYLQFVVRQPEGILIETN